MSPPADPSRFQRRYEALRREALGPPAAPERGHGLALFLSRGMAAWMAALSALPAPPRTFPRGPGPARRRPELAVGARSDLTLILAGMVLACREEASHE